MFFVHKFFYIEPPDSNEANQGYRSTEDGIINALNYKFNPLKYSINKVASCSISTAGPCLKKKFLMVKL